MSDGSNLDPRDWESFDAQAQDLLRACIDRIRNADQHPWQSVPPNIEQLYRLDGDAHGFAQLASKLRDDILPYHTGNTHGRFWGWVHGTGLASGLLSEMVAATMNSNCGGRDHGAVYLEREVIRWSAEVMGMPDEASGVLCTGTSQATLMALYAAKVRAFGADIRQTGQVDDTVRVYARAGVHNATASALELLGFGRAALCTIDPLDEAGLRAQIADDLARGHRPFAIVATAGSVDLGAYDDLPMLRRIADEFGLWLHVDGAFGAWTRLADAPYRGLSDGIGAADSIACDFHKWMYVPYDCGMLLMRDETVHRAAFAARPSYLSPQVAGVGGGDPWFCDYGMDLSRGNRALKVWAAVYCYGQESFGAAITRNCDLAHAMGEQIQADPLAQLAAPVMSNLCVFSANATLPPDAQSDLNRSIAVQMQLSGEAVFSTTTVDGITVLRAAITNHRTTLDDVRSALRGAFRLAQAH